MAGGLMAGGLMTIATAGAARNGSRSPRQRFAAVGTAVAAALYAATVLLSAVLLRGRDRMDAVEAGYLFAFLLYAVVGGVVAWHRPANPVGWLFLAAGGGVLLSSALDAWALFALAHDVAGGVWARWAQGWLYSFAWGLGTTVTLLFLPDGRLPSPRWRVPLIVLCGLLAFDTLAVAVLPGPIGDLAPVDNPAGIPAVEAVAGPLSVATEWTLLAAAAIGLVTLVVRWRLGPDATRRKLAWLGLGALAVVALGTLGAIVDALGAPYAVGVVLVTLQLAAIPAAVGVAILRDRLFDIEALFSRGLVYTALTALVVVTYAVSLAVTTRWLSTRADVAAAVVATALVAVGLGAVKDRLQSRVERLLFGDRSRPYRVLAGLGATAHELGSGAHVLPSLAELVRAALRLPYVAVHLAGDPGDPGDPPIEAGERPSAVESFPLTVPGGGAGELVVGRRTPGEPLSEADRGLLGDAARQIATAAHSFRLARDLQAARQRLVRAREQERVRVRRDLHDGLGPLLGAVTLQLDVLAGRVPADDLAGRALAERIKTEVRQALSDLRRVVDGLRPAALDELGLREALEAHASALRGAGLGVTVDCPAHLDAGPAAEVAAYHIVTEALANVRRHARASHAEVTIEQTGDTLLVAVTDDGTGHADASSGGVGLMSMRERAAELGGGCEILRSPGGGTCVRARIPRERP
jgi:signal transduction histidine kinase